MAVKNCPQCGATVEVDAKILSTTCAFCDSPLVLSDKVAEPADKIAAFVVTRDQAATKLKGFLQGQWLAPESLRKAARPDELAGVLVPFYTFDATARTSFTCEVGVYWYRTETYTVTVNGKTETRTRQVRETEWFPMNGTHGKVWLDHLVSASRGLPEAEANALEPFDLGQAVKFAPALTAGLVAEHPTVPHEEARRIATQELAGRERDVIAAKHLPGDTYRSLQSQTSCELGATELVLLPVWVAAVRGPKGPVRLLVNGQTGEVVGNVPRSGWKIGCLVALVLGLIFGLFLLVGGGVGCAALLESM